MKSRKNSPVIADTLFQQHIVFGSEEYSGTADTKGMALCRRICGNLSAWKCLLEANCSLKRTTCHIDSRRRHLNTCQTINWMVTPFKDMHHVMNILSNLHKWLYIVCCIKASSSHHWLKLSKIMKQVLLEIIRKKVLEQNVFQGRKSPSQKILTLAKFSQCSV